MAHNFLTVRERNYTAKLSFYVFKFMEGSFLNTYPVQSIDCCLSYSTVCCKSTALYAAHDIFLQKLPEGSICGNRQSKRRNNKSLSLFYATLHLSPR